MPNGLEQIGSRAFADTGLESIYIPVSVQSIASDAFAGCTNLSPVVELNSYADQWCTENGYKCWHYIGLGVASHTQREIRQFAAAHPAETGTSITFRRQPTASPYSPGLVSDYQSQNGLNMLNQIRYIAGLNADVVIDPDKEEMEGAAALVNGLNGELDHYPDRPYALQDSRYDDLYSLAKSGASSSNLHMEYGYQNLGNLANSIPFIYG